MDGDKMANMEHENENPRRRNRAPYSVVYALCAILGVVSGLFLYQALMSSAGYGIHMAFLVAIGCIISMTAFVAVLISYLT